jgi:hypothetical protein
VNCGSAWRLYLSKPSRSLRGAAKGIESPTPIAFPQRQNWLLDRHCAQRDYRGPHVTASAHEMAVTGWKGDPTA